MTLASFNARLKLCDPALRVRRRTGWVLHKSEGFAMAGLFRRDRYLGFSTITGDVPFTSRPQIWRVERIPGSKQKHKYVHARLRRGRRELVSMLKSHHAIKYRWQRQLLMWG